MKQPSEFHLIEHGIPPVYGPGCRVLVLGSFPSVKSREAAFFYGHPQNRFWKMLGAVYGCAPPETVEQKKAFLLAHGIALWDVIARCRITGSSDASIRDAAPNDLSLVLNACPIERILANGATAAALYERFCLPQTGIPAIRLPSTSPANASFNLQRLVESWKPQLFI